MGGFLFDKSILIE